MKRTLECWLAMDPQVMHDTGSKAALFYALQDAIRDIETLARLLTRAAYPRRGTPDESLTIEQFAAMVQEVIPLADAANALPG